MPATVDLTAPNASLSTPPAALSEAAILWAHGGNEALLKHMLLENIKAGLLCPQCGDPCGHIYRDADTPEGCCLPCKIGWEDAAIADYERFEAATYGAELVCSCGAD